MREEIESIVGVHVVKSFAQEERRQQRFEIASGEVFDQSVVANTQRAGEIDRSCWRPVFRSQAGTVFRRAARCRGAA